MLNALSLTSIYVFDQLLHPLVRDQQKWLHRNVGWFYRVLWLFPVVGASLYMNVRSPFTIGHMFLIKNARAHGVMLLQIVLTC